MGLCEGNWKSEIKFDQKAGDDTPPAYDNDGTLHICPAVNTEIRGQQTVPASPKTPNSLKTFYLQDGSCVPQGADGRFQIEYRRETPGKEIYYYKGSGWGLNRGDGPAFIYGKVTVISEGKPEDGREGTWEAIRIGGHRPASGPGEDGKGGPHDGN